MSKFKYSAICIVVITSTFGCASSTSLERQAANNAKAGEYYRSIGQHQTANEEFEQARKNRKDAKKGTSILTDLIDLLTNDTERK